MGWYRAWAKFTTSANASYIILQGYEYNANEIWVEDLQVEQGPKHTPYLPGSRTLPSYVTFPSLPSLSTYTVVGQFIPLSPFDNTYNITPNQSILFTLKDTNTSGDAQYRYYVSGTTSAPFIETTGSFGTYNYHAAYTVSAFVPLWYVIRKSGTAFSCDIYQNGFKGTHTFTLPVNNQLNAIELGGNESTVWPGYHRNLSLYNRSLSDSEVQQMIAGRQVLRPDGSLGCLLNENVNPNLWPNADFQSLTYGVQGNGAVTLKTTQVSKSLPCSEPFKVKVPTQVTLLCSFALPVATSVTRALTLRVSGAIHSSHSTRAWTGTSAAYSRRSRPSKATQLLTFSL
jgi:hypothetical protein